MTLQKRKLPSSGQPESRAGVEAYAEAWRRENQTARKDAQ